jgi:large subunit ribosomal protein L5
MDITIVTTATTNDAGKALLDAYGFPFRRGVDETAADEPRRRRGPARGRGRGGRPAKRN